MSHVSVPPKHFTTKSAGYIIHVVFLVTLLILNHIGQGWLHNVSCDWSILKIHFHKIEFCYSWATALITRQTVPQICQNINRYCHMDHVKQLVTTFAILVGSTHPMRRWQKMYESVRKLHSIMITWQHSTSEPVPELDTDINLIHDIQINNLMNMVVLLSDRLLW